MLKRFGFLMAGLVLMGPEALAQIFTPTSGTQSWNVNSNWSTGTFPNGVGASATFTSPASNELVNLNQAITVGTITVTNNGTSILTIQNGTAGNLIFDAAGTGPATLTLNGTNSVTNNVVVSASVSLTDSLTVTNNNVAGTGSGTLTFTGTLLGSGGFTKDGLGRTSFTNATKAYTGATVINQGRLRVTTLGQMTGTSSILVNSSGSLYLDSVGTYSLGNPASAVITINGDGDGGSGTLAQTQGALRTNAVGNYTLTNAVALGSNATVHVDGSTSILLLNGELTGSSTLTKSGAGTLQLATANASLTGGTLVQNGTIAVNSGANMGTGALSLAQTAGSSTAITLNNAIQSIGSLSSTWIDTTGSRSQTITLNGTALTINQSADGTFGDGAVSTLTGVIAGTGSIIKQGTGNFTLTGINTYTGVTTVSNGTFTLGHSTNTLADSTAVTVSGGTLAIGINSDTVGVVTLNGGAITGTLGILTGSAFAAQNGTSSAILGGTGTLTKTTSNTVVLSAANTYSGGTAVNAGSLLVTNTIGSGTGTGAVNVNSGGLFGGTGIVGGTTTVVAGGTIRGDSGTGTGTLTLASDLTIAGAASNGGRIQSSVSGAAATVSNSKLGIGTNTLTLANGGNKFVIDLLQGTTAVSEFELYTITLAIKSASGIFKLGGTALAANDVIGRSNYDVTNNFQNGIYGDYALKVDSTGNNLVLTFTPVPEPGTVLGIGAAGLGLLGAFRRFRNRRVIEGA